MIAMGLISAAVIYLIALLLAALLPRGRRARFISVGVVLSPIIYWCSDIPIGYAQFRLACEREAGLKVLEPITRPASVVRLDAAPDSAVYAIEVGLLNPTSIPYPWLVAFEAAEPGFEGLAPPVYARYERVREPVTETTEPPKLGDRAKITRMDLVEQRWPQLVVRPGASNADYILSRANSSRAIRQSSYKFELRTSDGRLIATAANLVYSWSDHNNTMLGRAIKVSRCPDGWDTGTSLDRLMRLTSGDAK